MYFSYWCLAIWLKKECALAPVTGSRPGAWSLSLLCWGEGRVLPGQVASWYKSPKMTFLNPFSNICHFRGVSKALSCEPEPQHKSYKSRFVRLLWTTAPTTLSLYFVPLFYIYDTLGSWNRPVLRRYKGFWDGLFCISPILCLSRLCSHHLWTMPVYS